MANQASRPESKEFADVYEREIEAIKKKRELLGQPLQEKADAKGFDPDYEDVHPPFDLMGIALSGGGIRSATLSLGFLETLNKYNILKLADYLSTVSGGGYTGSYVIEKLRSWYDGNNSSRKQYYSEPYSSLFVPGDIEHIKSHGSYLVPGKTPWEKFKGYLIMAGGFIGTGLLHLLWYFLAFMSVLYFFKTLVSLPIGGIFSFFLGLSTWILALAAVYYYFFHGLRFFNLWPVKELISIIGIFLCVSAAFYIVLCTPGLPSVFCSVIGIDFLVFLFLTVVLGFFANPNILSPAQFYRFRLTEAFRWFSKKRRRLNDLIRNTDTGAWVPAPYPLINATINLSGDVEPVHYDKANGQKWAYSGYKTCDYFLLSPFFCGSKLTGFIDTDSSEYRLMTLSTAVTISGAALNPEMGYKSNKILAFFMTLLNIRLGYWAFNPYLFHKNRKWGRAEQMAFRVGQCLEKFRKITKIEKELDLKYFWPTYWPIYNIYELLNLSKIRRWRVNVSDGGHIENLGVFQLLHRKCKLIIAVDSGADPEYSFSDLKNLVTRARNELGLEISFRQDPEKYMRPSASSGFSRRHFCVADVCELPKVKGKPKKSIGILVYVKASVTPQETKVPKSAKKDLSITYKLYHPDFPQETTADQFFDEAQWDSYYETGKEMAEALVQECTRWSQAKDGRFPRDVSLEELLKMVNSIGCSTC